MIFKTINQLGHEIGIPHYWYHAVIAILIQLSFGLILGLNFGWAAGMFFYVGREFRDYEKEGTFDKYGMIFPVVATTLVFITLHFLN